MTNVIQILTLFVILLAIETHILPVLLPVALPYLIYQWRLAKMGYLKEHERTTKRRWTRYFVTRLTSGKSVAEVKLLDLAPLLSRKLSEFRDQNRWLHARSLFGSSLFAVLSTAAFYLTFFRVAIRALEGALTVGDVAIYGGAASGLRYTLEYTVLSVSQALERTLYISNLREFLSLRPRLAPGRGLTTQSSRGEIQLKNVSFRLPGLRPSGLNRRVAARQGG